MDYALDRFESEVRAAITHHIQIRDDLIELSPPRSTIPADLAFPVFKLAGQFAQKPPDLAHQIATGISFDIDTLVGSVAAAGPYVNFSLDPARLAGVVLQEVEELGARYGEDDFSHRECVLVEYSSPNMTKRMHVGHIRSTIIGQSLAHIFRALGYHTVSDNHIGDWGTQFGMNIAAIIKWGKPEGDGEEALAKLEEIYARYNALAAAEPSYREEAREWSLRLEQGDPVAREHWKWIVDLATKANAHLYDRLGVRFDSVHGESFFEGMMADIIKEAEDKGVAKRDDDGALVVDLDDLPTFLLQRSDGGTLYITRDVATIIYREDEYRPRKIIYVVEQKQELHFRQLFALVKALGYAKKVELIHVQFGTIFDAAGKPLSTREGNMVYLEALLNDAHTRARAIVEQASSDLTEMEKDDVAEIVGVGGVIYNDLFQGPQRNITLDWDRMLSIEGNSAPYVQYMVARCRSILRKAQEEDPHLQGTLPDCNSLLLVHPSETELLKQIAKLPAAVRQAGERYTAVGVAEWCFETGRALSGFYRDCMVLKAETESLRHARLHLVAAAAQALSNGLALLGIRSPERM